MDVFCHPQEIFDEAIYLFSNNILCLSTEVRGMHMSWQALHRQAHQSILSVLNCYQSPICLYLPSRDCQISERTMLSEATIPYAAIPWLKLTSALYHHVILYRISFSFDTMWHNNNMYRDFRFNIIVCHHFCRTFRWPHVSVVKYTGTVNYVMGCLWPAFGRSVSHIMVHILIVNEFIDLVWATILKL